MVMSLTNDPVILVMVLENYLMYVPYVVALYHRNVDLVVLNIDCNSFVVNVAMNLWNLYAVTLNHDSFDLMEMQMECYCFSYSTKFVCEI